MNPFRGLTEDQHCRFMNAANMRGKCVDSTSKDAVAWCAFGIMAREGIIDERWYGFKDFVLNRAGIHIDRLNDDFRKPFSYFADMWDEFEQSRITATADGRKDDIDGTIEG